jgi:hypothetical protein
MRLSGEREVGMDDLQILRELLREDVQLTLDRHYNRYKLRLDEPQQSEVIVEIHNVPENCLVIKGDAFVPPTAVFQNSRGECKRADYIIIVDDDHTQAILCLELKTGRGDSDEIIQQLKGAACFVAYCREIGRAFWQKSDFLTPDQYQTRYISLVQTRLDKQPTRHKQPPNHDHPERPLKLSGRRPLQFRQLVG